MNEHQKQLEIAAIDDGYRTYLIGLFGNLVSGGNDAGLSEYAIKCFITGLTNLRLGYDKANEIIGREYRNMSCKTEV